MQKAETDRLRGEMERRVREAADDARRESEDRIRRLADRVAREAEARARAETEANLSQEAVKLQREADERVEAARRRAEQEIQEKVERARNEALTGDVPEEAEDSPRAAGARPPPRARAGRAGGHALRGRPQAADLLELTDRGRLPLLDRPFHVAAGIH